MGKKIEFAMYTWDDCQGIEGLNMMYLIKIEDDDESSIHDQLRDLGRSIFCEDQPLMKHNGLWVDEEAFKGLTEKKVTYDTPFSFPSSYFHIFDLINSNLLSIMDKRSHILWKILCQHQFISID